MESGKPRDPQSTRLPSNALERAFIILDHLEAAPYGLTNSEISRAFGLPTSSCSYILNRLEKRGYLTRDARGRYKIGAAPIVLAHSALRRISFWSIAEPALYRLVEETGVSASIGILERGHILVVDRIEGPQFRDEAAKISEDRLLSYNTLRRREDRHIGRKLPVHSNALGKAILAHLPRDVTLTILKEEGLPKITRNTITSQREFINQLDLFQARGGHAHSLQEQYEGIHGLAVPITDSNGVVRAAVCVTPTVEQARWEVKDLHLGALKQAAQSISRRTQFQRLHFQ